MEKPEFSMYTSRYDPRQKHYEGKHRGALTDYVLYAGLGMLLGLIFMAVFALLNPAEAQDRRTNVEPTNSRLLLGVSAAQVQQAIAARCIETGWTIEEATQYYISCSHEGSATQSFWMTPGQGSGRRPRWFLRYSYSQLPGENPTQLAVRAEAYMQTYTFTGNEGQRVPANAQGRAQLETQLYALEQLCTQPCGRP